MIVTVYSEHNGDLRVFDIAGNRYFSGFEPGQVPGGIESDRVYKIWPVVRNEFSKELAIHKSDLTPREHSSVGHGASNFSYDATYEVDDTGMRLLDIAIRYPEMTPQDQDHVDLMLVQCHLFPLRSIARGTIVPSYLSQTDKSVLRSLLA